MKCPKCGEKAAKDDRICRNCGTVLKKESKGFLLLGTKKAPSAVPALETKSSSSHSATRSSSASYDKSRILKTIGITAVGAVIIILVVVLVFHVASGKGQKQAEKLAEYIGNKVASAEKDLEINLKDNSSFSSVNKSDTFDFIYESEDSVKVNDVTFPEWAVTVTKTQSDKIEQVVFTDYRVLKKDARGEKTDKRFDLSKYDRNTKINTVLDDIDIKPFRITYDAAFRKYEYRYYYKLDSGDVQSVILTVNSNSDNKYMYSVSDDIYPIIFSNDLFKDTMAYRDI